MLDHHGLSMRLRNERLSTFTLGGDVRPHGLGKDRWCGRILADASSEKDEREEIMLGLSKNTYKCPF